jgi:hypothetical protein
VAAQVVDLALPKVAGHVVGLALPKVAGHVVRLALPKLAFQVFGLALPKLRLRTPGLSAYYYIPPSRTVASAGSGLRLQSSPNLVYLCRVSLLAFLQLSISMVIIWPCILPRGVPSGTTVLYSIRLGTINHDQPAFKGTAGGREEKRLPGKSGQVERGGGWEG